MGINRTLWAYIRVWQALILAAVLAIPEAHSTTMASYSYTPLAVPGTVCTFAGGINNKGEISGYYVSKSQVVHGFLFDHGTYQFIDLPPALSKGVGVALGKINNFGVATASDASVESNVFSPCDVYAGFPCYLYNGSFTPINTYSGNTSLACESVADMNDLNTIVGQTFTNPCCEASFIVRGNSIATFAVPGSYYTAITSINNDNSIAGYYINAENSGIWNGFIYTKGTLTRFTTPDQSSFEITGINNIGNYVGYKEDGGGFIHRDNDDEVLNAPDTDSNLVHPVAINDSQQIVANYVTYSNTHALLAVPVTPPTLLQLAQASQDSYTGNSAPPGYTFLTSTCDTAVSCAITGFRAVAYISNNRTQIIIAFRGTVAAKDLFSASELEVSLATLKSFFAADVPFVTGALTPYFTSSVYKAVSFVKEVYAQSPKSTITVTGHSLGGALAQLIGAASGAETAVFDAPGTGILYPKLNKLLTGLPQLGQGHKNINYRLYGDQVSNFGLQLNNSSVITISPSISKEIVNQDPFSTIFIVHQISTMVDQIAMRKELIPENGPGPNIVNSLIKHYIISTQNTPDQFIVGFLAFVSQSYYIDPDGGIGYSLSRSPGAAKIKCVNLPFLPSITKYAFRIKSNGSWQQSWPMSPGKNYCVSSGVDGVEFEALDSHDRFVTIPGSLIFSMQTLTNARFRGILKILSSTSAAYQ